MPKAIERVRSIGRPMESVEKVGDAGVRRFYHLPQITLEAFAVYCWEDVPAQQQALFRAWRWDPSQDFVHVMVSDLMHLLEVRVQKGDISFVTLPPFPPSQDAREVQAAQTLAKAFAEQIGVPFRRVLKTSVRGPSDSHQVHAQLDATVEKGTGVLLVQDVVASPRLLRRSVRELAGAGCHVLVLAWAVEMTSEDALQALR